MLRGLRLRMARPLLARMGLNTIHTTAIVRAQTIVPRPPPSERVKPTSPAYFTTKPSYIDTLLMLDQLTREIKRELEQSYILQANSKPPPLPQGPTNIWVSREILRSRLGINLRASQFRSIISRLTLLLRYRALVIANFTGENESMFAERSTTQQKQLAQKMEEVFATFMSSHGKAQDAQKRNDAPPKTSTRGYIDEQGRAYARGRRKESSARIWLVPAKNPDLEIGEVLVNGTPLSQYFTRAAHREQVLWPLKLAGVLGHFNIFALTQSGGQTGQAGAVAHGIANALVAQLASANGAEAQSTYERVKLLLSKDGILNRDPRMVERKKPGLAKARKAFTWVKR